VLVSAIEGATRVGTSDEWGVSAWAVPHRPWATFATRAVAVGDERAAVAQLKSDLAAGRDEVVVEGPPPRGLGSGRVLAIDRRAETVRVEAEAAGDALLILNDAWWPGWEARVDGVPVPIHRADLLVRAIPWPPGRHVLEMRYRPAEVLAGEAISAAAAGMLLVVAAVAGVRARRSRG